MAPTAPVTGPCGPSGSTGCVPDEVPDQVPLGTLTLVGKASKDSPPLELVSALQLRMCSALWTALPVRQTPDAGLPSPRAAHPPELEAPAARDARAGERGHLGSARERPDNPHSRGQDCCQSLEEAITLSRTVA